MKKIICGAVAAFATLTLAVSAEAAPASSPSTGDLAARVSSAAQELERVHWRPYRHCHTRRVVRGGWRGRKVRIVRTCHGGRWR